MLINIIKRYLLKGLSIALILSFFIPIIVLAYSFYYDISITETLGNSYTYIPLRGAIDNLGLVTDGKITATGLNTRVYTSGGVALPHMLADNKLLFATNVTALSSQTVRYAMGESSLSAFDIITGYGGYVTKTDNATIELGGNFTLEQSGYVDLSTIGANFTAKDGAIQIYTSGSSNITAQLTGLSTNVTANGVTEGEHILKVAGIRSSGANNWLAGWSYRQEFQIDGTVDGSQTNYQLQANIYPWSGNNTGNNIFLNNHTAADLDDLRFTTADGMTELDYWINQDVDNVDMGLSDFIGSIGFLQAGAFYANGKTYIGYVAGTGVDEDKVKILTYTHSTRTFSAPVVLTGDLGNHDYARPTVVVDNTGIIHVFYEPNSQTVQGGQMVHLESDNPYDISSFSAGTVPASTSHTVEITSLMDSSGNIYLIYQDMPTATEADIAIRKSSDNGVTWTNPISGYLVDFGDNILLWPMSFLIIDDVIYGSYAPSATGTEDLYNLYFIQGETGGTVWKKADDTTIATPATAATSDIIYTSASSGVMTRGNDIRLEPTTDNPYMLMAAENGAAGNMEWYLAKHDGVNWTTTKAEEFGDSGGIAEAWGLIEVMSPNDIIVLSEHSYTGIINKWVTTDGGTNWTLLDKITDTSAGCLARVHNSIPGFDYFYQGYNYTGRVIPASIEVWVEFDSIAASPTATIFYAYYGNSGAAADSNAANTFLLYDDFERGINGDPIGGSWTVTNGSVIISTTQAYQGTRAMKLVGGVATPGVDTPLIATGNYTITLFQWRDNHNGDGAYIQHGNGAKVIDTLTDGFENIQYYDGALHDTGVNATNLIWQSFELNDISFTAGTYDIWHEGIKIKNDATTWASALIANKIALATSAPAGQDVYIDYVIVRAWTDNEPTWGAWSGIGEEPSASAGSLSIYIDGVLYDITPWISGNITDNANDWTFIQSEAMPYANYISIDIGGVNRLLWQPDSIILGNVLPDEGGNNQDGEIHWGTNPPGITLIISAPSSPLTEGTTSLNIVMLVVYSAFVLVIVIKIMSRSTIAGLLFAAIAIYLGTAFVRMIQEALDSLW
jgi:hypothetical protein